MGRIQKKGEALKMRLASEWARLCQTRSREPWQEGAGNLDLAV